MRWKGKILKINSFSRVVRKFLWLPKRPLKEIEWRWLEWANIKQRLGNFGSWYDYSWVDG